MMRAVGSQDTLRSGGGRPGRGVRLHPRPGNARAKSWRVPVALCIPGGTSTRGAAWNHRLNEKGH